MAAAGVDVRGAYTQVEGQDEQIMMLEQQLLAVHEESAREAADLRAEVDRLIDA